MTQPGTSAPEQPIHSPSEITPAWLGRVLDVPVHEVLSTTLVHAGPASTVHLVRHRADDGEGVVVVKLAAVEPEVRANAHLRTLLTTEVGFLRDLAPLTSEVAPRVHLAVCDEEGWQTIVMAQAPGSTPDLTEGCTVEQAAAVMRALARLHAPFVLAPPGADLEWLHRPHSLTAQVLAAVVPTFLERLGDLLSDEHVEVCRAFAQQAGRWFDHEGGPRTVLHGNVLPENLLLDTGGATLVDFQGVTVGPALRDVAGFLGTALPSPLRAANERDLVRAYRDELAGLGVDLPLKECWEEYRRQSFAALAGAIAGAAFTAPDTAADRRFALVVTRVCQQVLDVAALEALTAVGGTREPLRPAPEEEFLHAPGPDTTWNESYYFDAASEAGDLGIEVRLGRVPNRDHVVLFAGVVGEDRAPVLVHHDDLPLTAADDPLQAIEVAGVSYTQECVEPLQRFRIRLRAAATAYSRPSDVFDGTAGTPTSLELDLVWETSGVPYQWRESTRYEIPCRVRGTVRVGAEVIDFDGPGQRDHSHGSRDWWANDWKWSAMHYADGTSTHVVTLPELPGYAVGYAQQGGEVREVTHGSATSVEGEPWLPAEATTTTDVVTETITPVAWGPFRMASPDGRVAHFSRALARAVRDDGTRGVGWIEWNHTKV